MIRSSAKLYRKQVIEGYIGTEFTKRNSQAMLHILLILLLLSFTSAGQQLKSGTYEGIEVVSISGEDSSYWPGSYSFGSNIDNQGRCWYHKVTILVQDSSVSIEKIPFWTKEGYRVYSDSTGGSYYYKGSLYKINDTTFNLRGDLIQCKYCPRTATATPRYVRAFYTFHRGYSGWFVDFPFKRAVEFRKR